MVPIGNGSGARYIKRRDRPSAIISTKPGFLLSIAKFVPSPWRVEPEPGRGTAMAVTTPTRERTAPFISHKSQHNNMT